MTDTRINARPASRWMGLLGAVILAAPGLAHAQALNLFYERTVMSAADDRCGLFAPDTAAALAAGTAQARGAALRAGASLESLHEAETNAWAKVRRVDCASSDIQTAAQRVRVAFAGFAKLTRLTYPGDVAGWSADRAGGQQARWRLMQNASFGSDRMTFGLAGRDAPGVLLAVAQFADGAQPYTARLLVRDADRSSGPYLDRRTGGQLALNRRLPPREGLKAYTAEARSVAGLDLLPKDARAGWAFRFPAAAVRDLARLDPREAVMVEFVFADGDGVRRAYVEVGDFAAARAFAQLAQR